MILSSIQITIKCLLFISSSYFVNGLNLVDIPGDSKPSLKVYKIMKTNNKLWLQKDSSEGYNPEYVKRFLKDNADIEFRMNNIAKQSKSEEYPKGAHKVLVKRIIPHNQHTPNLEYDRKNNVFFRPLIRFHLTKKADDNKDKPRLDRTDYIVLNEPENNVLLKKIDNRHKDELLDTKSQRERAKAYNDKALLELFGKQGKKTAPDGVLYNVASTMKLLREIQVLSRTSKFGIPKQEINKYLLNILKEVYELYKVLRKGLEETNDENDYVQIHIQSYSNNVLNTNVIIDLLQMILLISEKATYREKQLISRKLAAIKHEVYSLHKEMLAALLDLTIRTDNTHAVETEVILDENKSSEIKLKKKKLALKLPSDHYFNYWIYKKSVYEDDCPGQQVKIGNVCAWIPPH